jgi:uncharacterized membrane protein YoaK (UPF0700 family)
MSKIFAHVADTDIIHVLAFVGGFVDAAGYIKIRGVFTSSITGNLVVACASVTSLSGVICRSCVSIAFAAGAGFSAMLALKLRLAHSFSLPYLALVLFSLEIVMLAITWAVGHYLDQRIIDSNNLDEWPVVLLGCFMGASMGFHNVAAKESITGCPPTTVMTSTLINVSSGLSNSLGLFISSCGLMRLTPPNGLNGSYKRLTKEEKSILFAVGSEMFFKTVVLIKPLISFLVGALIGAVTMEHGSFHCLAIPIAALCGVLSEIFAKIYTAEKVVSTKNPEQQMTYLLSISGTNVVIKSEPFVPENIMKVDEIPDKTVKTVTSQSTDNNAKSV